MYLLNAYVDLQPTRFPMLLRGLTGDYGFFTTVAV